MTNEAVLALIAIASSVVSAVIARIKGKREQSEEQEDKMTDHLLKQSNELLELVKSRSDVQDRQIGKLLNAMTALNSRTASIENSLKNHIEQETAIDEVLVSVLKGAELNGELKYAEHLIEQAQRSFKFRVDNGGNE